MHMSTKTFLLACVAWTGCSGKDPQYAVKPVTAAQIYYPSGQSVKGARSLASLLLASRIPTTGWQVIGLGPRSAVRIPLAINKQPAPDGKPSGQTLRHHTDTLMQLVKAVKGEPRREGQVIIRAEDLALTYDGERYLFEDISMTIIRGLKLALIGPNGEGKSSLMKVLAGMQKPERGTVDLLSKTNVAFVEQEPRLPAGEKAVGFFMNPQVTSPNPAVKALFEYRQADVAATVARQEDEALNERLVQAAAQMQALEAWDLEEEVNRLVRALNVEHLLAQDADNLSGGERKRVALAAALVHKPELLLLDEPTNHLDMDAIQWLENEVRRKVDLTALIVTHDRAFLEGACQEVLELDRSQIFRHRGTYEEFLEAKQKRIEREEIINEATRDKLKKEKAWAARGCKARATKSAWRLENMVKMESRLKQADAKLRKSKATLTVEGQSQRMGGNLLELNQASLNTPSMPPRPVLYKFTYVFTGGDRIGIIGGNGVGKSTLLKALQGEMPLASGGVGIGDTVVFGYYKQEGLNYPKDAVLLKVVEEAVAQAPDAPDSLGAVETRAMGLLNRFMFPSTRWQSRVSELSGGEQRRVQLLEVLAKQPNVLLMDEPTNDLDLSSIAALEEFLLDFKGALVVVSHDRYFLDTVCNKYFVLDGHGKVFDWEGSVLDYFKYDAQKKKTAEKAELQAKEVARDEFAKKGMRKINPGKEIKPIEKELKRLTEKRDGLQKSVEEFDSEENTYQELGEWTKEIETLNVQIEEQEEKWLELADMM